MLTPVELAQAREYATKWQAMGGKAKDTSAVLLALLEHIDAITTHNRAMQVALAQFSDGVNWSTAPSVHCIEYGEPPTPEDKGVYIWHVATNPQQLAERALVGDGESSVEV